MLFAAATVLALPLAWGQEQKAKELDLRKRVIENPVKAAVAGRSAPAADDAAAARFPPPATPTRGAQGGGPPPAPELAQPGAAPPKRADRGKALIEFPVKNAVAGRTAPPGAPANPPPPTPPVASDNPKVEPGKVKWHADFAAACEAAKKSGKPVLLFHMMGNLDDKFC
jgi:hypothetical protein